VQSPAMNRASERSCPRRIASVSPPPNGRPLGTTRERAVRARADDGNRGRKAAQTGARRRTSFELPSGPLPHRDVHPGMRVLWEDDGPPTPAATQSGCSMSASHPRCHGRPQPAAGAPSSPARRPDRLAFYVGCCADRRAGEVICGSHVSCASSRAEQSAGFAGARSSAFAPAFRRHPRVGVRRSRLLGRGWVDVPGEFMS
jgi:hypothetical protein